MTLAIYQHNHAPDMRPTTCNAGLWFERFFDQYDDKNNWKIIEPADENDKNSGKANWLKKNFNRSTGDSEQLESHATQQLKLISSQRGSSKVFATQWHFVAGMGNPHPVENGLSWHPTLGVPYLNGAAVKGLVRSWLEAWQPLEKEKEQKQKLLNWFGSTGKDPFEKGYQALTGNLIFFDAFPVEPVLMNVDIMTPHMGKWYEQGGEISHIDREPEKVPADWHDPVPIPFLVVKKASFLFSIAPRNQRCDIDMNAVMQALENALDYMGAGAKTAVGYGQMLDDSHQLNKLQRRIAKTEAFQQQVKQQQKEACATAERLANMNPLQQEIEQITTLPELITLLTNNHWDDSKQAASYVKARLQREKQWKESSQKKNPRKDKLHQRTLTVMKYL